MNLEGARLVCGLTGISDAVFYSAISSFNGAANRLELVAAGESNSVYRDFAHAPSKLGATINAAREQFPDRQLVACFELHTYSSLSRAFLDQYQGSMEEADLAIVYYSPHALSLKKLPDLNKADIIRAFDKKGIRIFTDSQELKAFLLSLDWKHMNLLMMSSGNYDGLNMKELAIEITG
jgi:UDP-N-acetylmuramate: L-alanyl-gamma-D-glutamyl-meso-diaminopimelate ligase